MLARLATTMPTSTPHCTPTPIGPCPIRSRRPSRTVWSPSTLILVVVNCGGTPVHVAAAREAVAANSPITETRPVTPTEQTASTLRFSAQIVAAYDSLAAALATQVTVHLASKLRFTIARRKARPDDCVDIIAHADHGDEGLQHVECAVRIGGLAHACLSPRRLVNFDLGLGQHTSSSVGRICRQRTNLTLLVVLGILSASALHGIEDDLLRRAVLLDTLQGIGFQSHFGVQAQVRLPLEGAEIQSLTESPCFRHGHETHHAKAHRQNQSSLLHPTAGARWRVFRLFLGLRMDGLERCRHGRRISERFGTQAGGDWRSAG